MTPEPLQPKKEIHPTIFITILLVVAGLIGSFQIYSGYFRLPQKVTTQDSTTDWKTYRNEEYGFEIKYPADWVVTEDKSRAVFNISIDSPIVNNISKSFLIQIYPTIHKNLDEAVDAWIPALFKQSAKKREIFVNNQPALLVYYGDKDEFGYEVELIFIINKINLFSLSAYKYKDDTDLSKILSTFKFTSTSTNQGILPYKSGVEGTVTIGPTCPVERIPPDPNCADRPFKTGLAVLSADGGKIIKQFSSDERGNFKVDLEPGKYQIISYPQANVMPSCSAEVVVVQNQYTKTTILCDSGIR